MDCPRSVCGLSRRQFLRSSVGLAGVAVVAGCGPLAARSAPPKVPRIGLLLGSPDNPGTVRNSEAFRQGLADFGYVEGQNLVLESRYAGAGANQPEQAAELARLPVDILVTGGDPPMEAAQKASETIPIVFAFNSAPVETGVVASFAHPGGRATGQSELAPELGGKRLELLRDTVPRLARVGVIWSPQIPGPSLQYRDMQNAAGVLGLELVPLPVRSPEAIEPAFEAAVRDEVGALAVLTGPITNPNAKRIVGLAARSHLPAVYAERLYMDPGGLMSYGPDIAGMYRRAAYYVDRILKGTPPADLPVEIPTRFDFLINPKTAQALGLTIPQHVLLQATEII